MLALERSQLQKISDMHHLVTSAMAAADACESNENLGGWMRSREELGEKQVCLQLSNIEFAFLCPYALLFFSY